MLIHVSSKSMLHWCINVLFVMCEAVTSSQEKTWREERRPGLNNA